MCLTFSIQKNTVFYSLFLHISNCKHCEMFILKFSLNFKNCSALWGWSLSNFVLHLEVPIRLPRGLQYLFVTKLLRYLLTYLYNQDLQSRSVWKDPSIVLYLERSSSSHGSQGPCYRCYYVRNVKFDCFCFHIIGKKISGAPLVWKTSASSVSFNKSTTDP
jgi:hypothetical protein